MSWRWLVVFDGDLSIKGFTNFALPNLPEMSDSQFAKCHLEEDFTANLTQPTEVPNLGKGSFRLGWAPAPVGGIYNQIVRVEFWGWVQDATQAPNLSSSIFVESFTPNRICKSPNCNDLGQWRTREFWGVGAADAGPGHWNRQRQRWWILNRWKSPQITEETKMKKKNAGKNDIFWKVKVNEAILSFVVMIWIWVFWMLWWVWTHELP